MKEISIRRKITILMAATSIILILAILAVSYVVNKKNITELCESYLYDTCITIVWSTDKRSCIFTCQHIIIS